MTTRGPIDFQANLRNWLAQSFSWSSARVPFLQAVSGISNADCYLKPSGAPYSIWELTEHIRIAQKDILDYCKNPHYQSPECPAEYWPEKDKAPTNRQWEDCIELYKNDLREMSCIILNPSNDLFKPFDNGSGHNLFREAAILIDHTAYHTGQIILIRKLLGWW